MRREDIKGGEKRKEEEQEGCWSFVEQVKDKNKEGGVTIIKKNPCTVEWVDMLRPECWQNKSGERTCTISNPIGDKLLPGNSERRRKLVGPGGSPQGEQNMYRDLAHKRYIFLEYFIIDHLCKTLDSNISISLK